MEWLFYGCLFLVVYTYCGYPLLLIIVRALNEKDKRELHKSEPPKSVAVIVTVHNEVSALAHKLDITLNAGEYLTQRRALPVDIVVASDASTDGSDEVVQTYSARGVKLVRLAERGGKEVAQGEAFAATTADIVIFTDAKISHDEELFDRFLPYFDDSNVGAVSSCDDVLGELAGGSGEKMYVRYEMWLRSLEDECAGLVGASGSCFAVRRKAVTAWYRDVPSDFVVPLSIRGQGFVTRHAPDVVCRYQSVPSEEHEFRRKVRTVLRGISALWLFRERMNLLLNGFFAVQLVSHKLCRWLFPVFALGLITASLGMIDRSVLARLVFLASALGLSAALVAYLRPDLRKHLLFKAPLYLVVSNLSILVAWYRFLRGARAVHWTPSGRP